MRTLMAAMVVEKGLSQFQKELVLQEAVILEPVVGRVLVRLIVVEDVITVDSPSSSDPLVELFIDNTLFGKLIINIVLSGDLELGVLALALTIVMLLMSMIVTATASHRGVSEGL